MIKVEIFTTPVSRNCDSLNMTPRPVRQLTPLIHEIGEYNFERLCNELLEHEPDISKSDLYGTRGQLQRGIDLLAAVHPVGIEVGQCKCEKAFSVSKIRKVSEVFWKYWSFWRSKKVRRFILFVAGEANDTKISDEELLQRAEFEKRGISYEIWNSATICKKLRPHRSIARKYIDSEEIVDSICGPSVESPSLQVGIAVVVRQLGVFTAELEEVYSKELEGLRELSLAGEQLKALVGVQELENKPTWPDYSCPFRARVLRFKAAVWLNLRRDVDQAEEWVGEARKLDPEGDYQIIDAYLAYSRSDMLAALEILSEPVSANARNFRWGILLEAGKFDELEKELTAQSVSDLDAEGHRLSAMLDLVRQNISGAQIAIVRAAEAAPNRRNVRHIKAVFDYYSSISPVAEQLGRLAWPVPVAWSFVKRDATSVSNLKAAGLVFLDDAQQTDCPTAEQEILQIWHLACVANIETEQSEAAALAASILSEHPANYGVISWAIERGYAFDYSVSEKALRERLVREPENIELYLALWSLVFHTKDANAGEAVVDEAEQLFRQTNNQDIWFFHKHQFLTMRGEIGQARELVEQITDLRMRRSAENSLIRRDSRSSEKQRSLLASQLAEDFESTGDINALVECCDIKLGLGDYDYIATNASKLVEGVATAPALRLALEGAWRAEEHDLCLDLINKHRALFHEGALSSDIRHLKTVCLHRQGNWSESLQEAELIYRENPNVKTFFVYFELLVKSGDPRRCSTLARDLLSLKSVKRKHLLGVIETVQIHDRGLAIDLWHRANRRPIKGLKLAAVSMNLAFQLGLSKDAEPLLARLTNKAAQGKGPLMIKSFDEVTEMIRKDREVGEENSELYLKGMVPVHLIAENIGVPLISLYHQQLETNRAEPNLLRSPIIFGRAGNRVVQEVEPKKLLMDITAVLLAADIGILDLVESSFEEVLISPNVTKSIMEEISKVAPSQPERHVVREKFIQMVRSGEIETIDQIDSNALISDELAQKLTSEDLTLLESALQVSGSMLSDGEVLDASAQPIAADLLGGVSSCIRLRTDLEHHLGEGSEASAGSAFLPMGSRLLLPGSMIASLSVGVLEDAVNQFQLVVTSEACRDLEMEIERFQSAQRLVVWGQGVLDRLQRGIASGIYHVLPAAAIKRKEAGDWGASSRVILDALAYKGGSGIMVWCDDRMINRHYSMEKYQIIAISEVLSLLRANGSLSEREYYDKLLYLRRSNVRYLPIAAEEICYHLMRAPIKDGRVQETAALSTLRRYLNACMLDKERLQPPVLIKGKDPEFREFGFPLGLRQSVDDTLFAIWKDLNGGHKTCVARSNWLYENLYIDLNSFRQALIGATPAEELRESVGYVLGALFSRGIALGHHATKSSTESTERQYYFGWVESHLLNPYTVLDLRILPMVGQAIANFIVEQLRGDDDGADSDAGRVMRMLFAHFIDDLPVAVQAELNLPSDVQAELGLEVWGSSIRIEGRWYEPRLYWRAVAEAVNGRTGEAIDRQGDHKLMMQFDRCEASKVFVRIFSEEGEGGNYFSGDYLGVLTEKLDERLEFLHSCAHWFDCSKIEEELGINALALIEIPADRIEKLLEWRDNSPEATYRKIEREIVVPGHSFSLEELELPSWERLLSHLRLSGESQLDFRSQLNRATDELLEDEGFFVTLRRLIYLPMWVSEAIESHWCALGEDEAEDLFTRLRSTAPSLVSDLHCIRLAGLRNTPSFWSKAADLQKQLLDPKKGREEFACFYALLMHANEEFGRFHSREEYSPAVRLSCVWYHASRLHGSLRQINDGSSVVDWLEKQMDFQIANHLSRQSAYWLDVAHPRNVTFSRLVVRGLANVVGGLSGVSDSLGKLNDIEEILGGNEHKVTQDRLGLLRRTDLFGNELGSFIVGTPDGNLKALYGAPSLQSFFGQVSDEQVESAIDKLAEEPDDKLSWSILWGTIGDGRFPGELDSKFLNVIKSVNFRDLVRQSNTLLSMSLIFSCQQVAMSGDEKLIELLKGTIFKIAREASTGTNLVGGQDLVESTLLDALLTLAVTHDEEERSIERFFDYFREYLLICPKLSKEREFMAMEWLKKLPASMQSNLWPFILTARSVR